MEASISIIGSSAIIFIQGAAIANLLLPGYLVAPFQILAQAEQDESLTQDNIQGIRSRIAAKQKMLDEGLAELETKVEGITAPVREQRIALASTQQALQVRQHAQDSSAGVCLYKS
jgi:hypothetical protein